MLAFHCVKQSHAQFIISDYICVCMRTNEWFRSKALFTIFANAFRAWYIVLQEKL